ncbi:TIGR03767 family metallophosphoesterase [Nocardioides limicola]|uniref:TIGR03767 family metallophosphoesterase n=1 Tax=Nocardioides limicola TaxID=2803368 RepID=UPI00193BE75D|nr:TIGR03767 family metallophosphoesterase [Nocardioides sp. DJM-14]
MKSALFAAGAAVAVSAGGGSAAARPVIRHASLAAAAVAGRTTLTHTIVRGEPGDGGYARLLDGPGRPRVVRTDLGVAAAADREACRRPLLAFAHLSDIHIIDHQSPMRLEWTDRYDDPTDLGNFGLGLFTSAHRPQEIFSAHISESMVQAINNLTGGPVTGAPLEFAIETGDNSDNAQLNEIRWNIDILDGEEVTPDSGNRNRYEGVMDSKAVLNYDPHYWHPDGTPNGLLGPLAPDIARRQYGFPEVAGVLDTSRQPFQASGLRRNGAQKMEWYSVHGNHDGLVQGNFPTEVTTGPLLNALAVGPAKVIKAPAGLNQADVVNRLVAADLLGLVQDAILTDPLGILGTVRLVTPDPQRKLLTRKQTVGQYFQTSGLPVGHGFTEENRTNGHAYYFFDKGPIRFISMDTVNVNGYADGSLDPDQFAWLKQVIEASQDKAVILFSHHTSGTMSNPFIATGFDFGVRVFGAAVVEYLLTQPHVIAWFNGHTHRNQIWAHSRADGSGGFWEVNTASHIDFPQQARIVEVADNADGTMSIFTTILDHAAPAEWDGSIDSPLALASLAREIAANDWQSRTKGYEGAPEDANVELLVRTPAGLVSESCAVEENDVPTPPGEDPEVARLRARRAEVVQRRRQVRQRARAARAAGNRDRASRLRARAQRLSGRAARLRARIRELTTA